MEEGAEVPMVRGRLAREHQGPPAESAKLISEETEKWAKVVRAAGIKAE